MKTQKVRLHIDVCNHLDPAQFVSQISEKLRQIPQEKRANIFALVVLADKTAEKYNALKSELDLKVEITSQCLLRKNIEKANARFGVHLCNL